MKRLLITLSLVLLPALAVPQTAGAFDIFKGEIGRGNSVCESTGGGETDPANSAVCNSKETTNPLTGDNGLIIKVTNIVALVAGAAAVILIVIGGIRFMTAGGDSQKITDARKTVTGALIGIAVIVLARTIIVFVVKKL